MKESLQGQARDSLRGFWSLFVTQFQGAFSDNVLKNLVVFMLLVRSRWGTDRQLAFQGAERCFGFTSTRSL